MYRLSWLDTSGTGYGQSDQEHETAAGARQEAGEDLDWRHRYGPGGHVEYVATDRRLSMDFAVRREG